MDYASDMELWTVRIVIFGIAEEPTNWSIKNEDYSSKG